MTHTPHCCGLLIGRNAAHHETVATHPVPDVRSSMLRSRNDRSQGGRFPPLVAFAERPRRTATEPIRVEDLQQFREPSPNSRIRGGSNERSTSAARRTRLHQGGPAPGTRRWRDAARARSRRTGPSCATGRGVLRDRSRLHTLQRPIGRGSSCRRNGPLPVASRLLQPPHRRGAPGAGFQSRLALARGAGGRSPPCSGEARESGAPIAAGDFRCAPLGRHRRRRRGRQCRRGNSPQRGLRRTPSRC